VLVPRFPGITSALGCLLSDLRHDDVHSLWRALSEVDATEADKIFDDQAARGTQALESYAVPVTGVEVIHEADLMYRGQSHVFRVRVDSPGFDADRVATSFAERYAERFEIILADMKPVLASLRTTVIGTRQGVDLSLFGESEVAASAGERSRPVYFDGQWLETPLLQRDTLTNGLVVTGPAIVEQPDTTCVIDPGAVATVDDAGNLVIEVGGDN